MCDIVVINRGEIEIGSPRQFEKHFGFLPEKNVQLSPIDMDCCLCGYEIEEVFKEKGIEFKKDCGDYYVGELDLVKGDND